MAFRHMVLGFLLEFPVHGYELLKKVYADFYPAEPEINEGLLYSILKKMEAENLVTRQAELNENQVSRKVIHLTEAGQQEFMEWMLSDSDAKDTVKFDFFYQYPFLEKCNYFKHLNPSQRQDKINNQLNISNQRLKRYRKACERMKQRKVDPYRIAIIEYGIKSETLKIAWLEELVELARD